jgi:dihydrofolate reductase
LLKFIVAATKDNGIGFQGKIPWTFKEDLAFFKEQTLNCTVIMGRLTYQSLPEKVRPLPDRQNIVVSRSFSSNEVVVWRELLEPLKKLIAEDKSEIIWVIGGSSIYAQALHLCDEILLSRIPNSYPADTYFPSFSGTLVSQKLVGRVTVEHWSLNKRPP